MRTLLTGGSASGKSTYAEQLSLACPLPRYYIAAMRPYGEESLQRIEKHRAMRERKQFTTIERYTDIAGLNLPIHDGTVLLECICNLTANEMFDDAGAHENTESAITDGIIKLESQCKELIVITNNVGSELTASYADTTVKYMKTLGRINRILAQRFDRVFELVCGIPVVLK